MNGRHLAAMLEPARVALIGASAREGTIGAALTRHLAGAFTGALDLVNPRAATLAGRPVVPSVGALAAPPDLAIVAVPPDALLATLEDLARIGAKSAVVITDPKRGREPAESLRARAAALARGAGLRLCGPNSLGLAVPASGLHATFAELRPRAGGIAFVGQSATASGPLVDWANARGHGFSHIVSLGDMVDIDYADVIDASLADPRTRVIVVFAERLRTPRTVLSAIRAAARVKPVIVLLAGARERDAVFEAALRRAGAIRVRTLEDLFNAIAALLVRLPGDTLPAPGPRLAIVANGESIGALAEDTLAAARGTLAHLSPVTIQRLQGLMPPGRPRGNPIDILPDALPERLERTLQVLMEDPNIDAILVVAGPTGVTSTRAMAEAVARAVAGARARPGRRWPWVMASWPGGELSDAALPVFAASHIPAFETPSIAVRAFLVLNAHRRLAEALSATPALVAGPEAAPAALWREQLAGLIAAGVAELPQATAAALLEGFGIAMGAPAGALAFRLAQTVDPEFGPVLDLGFDGLIDSALGERVAGLPPLDATLARDLVDTLAPVQRLLAARALGEPEIAALVGLCVRLSELVVALPEIAALTLHGIRPGQGGATVAAATIALAPPAPARTRYAFRPYPAELARRVAVGGESLLLRPIRAEDEPALAGLFERLSPEDLRLRFFQPMRHLSHALAARLTQLDYERAMAFALIREPPDAPPEILAVGRLHRDREAPEAEFAITVASGLKRRGVGRLLMERILEHARETGITTVFGLVLAENGGMLGLAGALGFARTSEPGEPGVIRVVKTL